MKLIVGLGNPGGKYETTRHNIGFIVVDYLADSLNVEFASSKFKALVAEGKLGNEKIIICKPQTYMNLSGEAVSSILNYYKLTPEDVIVVVDDKDLDVGRLRVRGKGSSGGQRGIANIIAHLGTEQFARVKVGVGKPPQGWDTADYVLSAFKDDEWELLKDLIPKASEAALALARESVEQVMNKFNR